MTLTTEQRDNLRRWGIDPDQDEAEIIRQLNEFYHALRRARRKKAEQPVIVDMSGERR